MGNEDYAANQEKTGDGDGGIARQLEALGIKDQATGEGHDSATGDEAAGEVARRIKDFIDKAVAHLKEGRLGEAYVYANKALQLDKKDPKAAALHHYTLYALHPERRLLDKATALRKEADQCIKARVYDKAHELLTLATKLHGDPKILYRRALVNSKLGRFDLAYLDVTEALAVEMQGVMGETAVELQKSCLRSLRLKVPEQQQVPTHSPQSTRDGDGGAPPRDDQQDSKETGDGDGGIARQLEALGIKNQATGEGHDSATGDESDATDL